jgi:hypothetical protein
LILIKDVSGFIHNFPMVKGLLRGREKGEDTMTTGEIAFLVLVIAAMGVFGAVMAWATHRTSR